MNLNASSAEKVEIVETTAEELITKQSTEFTLFSVALWEILESPKNLVSYCPSPLRLQMISSLILGILYTIAAAK
jgi:hypothetical protein